MHRALHRAEAPFAAIIEATFAGVVRTSAAHLNIDNLARSNGKVCFYFSCGSAGDASVSFSSAAANDKA